MLEVGGEAAVWEGARGGSGLCRDCDFSDCYKNSTTNAMLCNATSDELVQPDAAQSTICQCPMSHLAIALREPLLKCVIIMNSLDVRPRR